MNSHPHTVTVGETYGDVAVSITLEFTDAAIGLGPQSTLGESLASPNNAIGRAVRDTLRKHLGTIPDNVNDAVWSAHIAEKEAAGEARAKTAATAIQAAKDETAKQLGALHDVYVKQSEERLAAVDAAYVDAEKRLRQDIDALKTQLAAKAKRSRAATMGHAKATRKAGRK